METIKYVDKKIIYPYKGQENFLLSSSNRNDNAFKPSSKNFYEIENFLLKNAEQS